ncbi:alpha/beta fold hydrolase [Dermatobacter hominis]|uniref:alpha/beta fold hydrolase n=1 Tax=Dermatobacter hominis TaxID=2884263 RepID=UPI001D126AD3|nr:alpha/beta hydrolase [Dermatobacter hominis]UDY35833.1 alpha/beta hydrolase [Dermatobacter hominis]
MPTSSTTDPGTTELFRSPPDRYIDVGSGQIACRTVGAGPPVLFVHGWPVSGATFRTLLPHLVDHVTCHVIDLVGAGESRVEGAAGLSLEGHIRAVRRVVDALDVDRLAVVGHDSGGLIARHAMAGDRRLAALGLIDTEQPHGLSWRFRLFLASRHLPGTGAALGWLAGRPVLRRSPFVLGDAFVDRSLLDGEFDEFFLRPLATDRVRRAAAIEVLHSFQPGLVHALPDVHRRIDVPVQLVWGAEDRFFPLEWAREMVGSFPDAALTIVPDAGLFAHEERPAEVAAALLPVLTNHV